MRPGPRVNSRACSGHHNSDQPTCVTRVVAGFPHSLAPASIEQRGKKTGRGIVVNGGRTHPTTVFHSIDSIVVLQNAKRPPVGLAQTTATADVTR